MERIPVIGSEFNGGSVSGGSVELLPGDDVFAQGNGEPLLWWRPGPEPQLEDDWNVWWVLEVQFAVDMVPGRLSVRGRWVAKEFWWGRWWDMRRGQ